MALSPVAASLMPSLATAGTMKIPGLSMGAWKPQIQQIGSPQNDVNLAAMNAPPMTAAPSAAPAGSFFDRAQFNKILAGLAGQNKNVGLGQMRSFQAAQPGLGPSVQQQSVMDTMMNPALTQSYASRR